MKRAFLFLLMVFTFSACETNSVHNTETNPSPTAIPITAAPSEKEATVFLAEAPDYLSAWDYETAYKLCAAALSDYYKAAWNGSEMDVDAYIGNENLKLYTQQKIQ
ncbi:MAG: hypothetical protein K0Q90_4247, partial [Paenibacillaceae bacterium]|nr:hypothetical protein [Paenibacillaceae bacterium]